MMHIPSLKEVTKEKKIIRLPDAPFYHISLQIKDGYVPELFIKEGDKVLQYQLLAGAGKALKTPVYSPVSGVVVKITGADPEKGELPDTIYIANDYLEQATEPLSPIDMNAGKDEVINRIEACGISGHGGAEFPAAMKYRTKGKEVTTFIVNGAECEPYLTADYAVMKQCKDELLEGIYLLSGLLDAKEVVIAVEEQNQELLPLFEQTYRSPYGIPLRTVAVPNEYPQGGEIQLIYSVTGIELSKGTIPLEAGIIMNNVGTIYAIRQALTYRRPVISRIVTVSGEYSGDCGNYLVKLGTPVSHILECTGYQEGKPVRILKGGPMMGKTVSNQATSISQGTNGVLVLPELFLERSPCIGCGYCVDVCPMSLMPFKYDHFYRLRDWYHMERYSLKDCIDCASCEYICPCEVPLMKSIIEGKKQLKKKVRETQKA